MKTRKFTLTAFASILLLFVFTSEKIPVSQFTDFKAAYIESEISLNEEKLEIEPWMTNDLIWSYNNEKENSDALVIIEEDLKIEAWMMNDDLWKF